MMTCRKISALTLALLCGTMLAVQPQQQPTLRQRAQTEAAEGHAANARSLYNRAYEDLARQGQMADAVECATKATALYYGENLYNEAFDLLRRVDQSIEAAAQTSAGDKAAQHYQTSRERFQMYMKMRRAASAMDQLTNMERHALASANDVVRNDFLYNKTIYYYTFGQTDKGNAAFREMADRLTADKEYDKVDEVYQQLITNGRRTGSANLVAQSYDRYIAWKDSVAEMKRADEVSALRQQIAEGEAVIAERDSSLAARGAVIVGLSILAAALAVVLVLGAALLMRFIYLTRKQKKTIREARENNALKAKFISNISAQLEPSLARLDSAAPDVQALRRFAEHIQTLSDLESTAGEQVALEDTPVAPFCEALMAEIRSIVPGSVVLRVDAPKMNAMINPEYTGHILRHLLRNAVKYAPADAHIALEFKKRSAHKHQFLVSNTGSIIPEERRDDVFKPFLEIRDLTQGDGLGLPICRQMAQKMNGDLTIDPTFTKGTRFILDLVI